jgi:hypothetical protein
MERSLARHRGRRATWTIGLGLLGAIGACVLGLGLAAIATVQIGNPGISVTDIYVADQTNGIIHIDP